MPLTVGVSAEDSGTTSGSSPSPPTTTDPLMTDAS
eukprot:CAMPEP_0195588596 /NCGR_PEP_ID=MMETSP0814-20130614/32937_1 /TAXON_ID=97485 /ORGANISM="Prymnesium parvum, Strain Texoma1" /LENGTH=34 /DNA_ID= /DNA_START= /DNA_END= /DNA_ORIENTATION=